MLSVETVIVATAIVAAIYLFGLFAVLHQLAPHDPRRITWRARYRRGRHHHPSLWTRWGAALAEDWRDAAAAQALWRGAQPWI